MEVVLDKECEPNSSSHTDKHITTLLKELIAEHPPRKARRRLRETALGAVALMLAPESGADLDVAKFEHSNIGFIKAIRDPAITNMIRQERALRWFQAWNHGHITTKERASVCELIAPRLAWNLTINEMQVIMTSSQWPPKVILPKALSLNESGESKTKEQAALMTLEENIDELRTNQGYRESLNKLIEFTKTLRCVYDAMPEYPNTHPDPRCRFNLIENRDFMPTEDDINPLKKS